jgi:Zn-dependent M28 family amino/carboxypeptidase
MKKIFIFIAFFSILISCANKSQQQTEDKKPVNVPAFNADSAYYFVKTQVDFGARVPNTEAHRQCAAYLSQTLKRFGAEVIEQRAVLTAFNGDKLNAVNIIGSFNPGSSNRVLLFAHWDSRPWADNDPDPANHKTPVMAANDGASGVGVLLEMARQFSIQKPEIGVDIIFFDAEDYGAPQNYSGASEDAWCLGSQYWANNPHKAGYTAEFGILLDMVGAPNATFYKEDFSMYYAAGIVEEVWSTAATLGFSNYFRDEMTGAITDDHVYINKIAGIPSIDIIQYRNEGQNSGFGHYWHTVNDTMENIDKNTLFAVGTTVMHVVYNE